MAATRAVISLIFYTVEKAVCYLKINSYSPLPWLLLLSFYR